MNNKRRKAIDAVIKRLEDELRPLALELWHAIEDILNEEQDYFDGLSEGQQDGDAGEKAQAAVEQLESAAGDLDPEEFLDSAIAALEAAKDGGLGR